MYHIIKGDVHKWFILHNATLRKTNRRLSYKKEIIVSRPRCYDGVAIYPQLLPKWEKGVSVGNAQANPKGWTISAVESTSGTHHVSLQQT